MSNLIKAIMYFGLPIASGVCLKRGGVLGFIVLMVIGVPTGVGMGLIATFFCTIAGIALGVFSFPAILLMASTFSFLGVCFMMLVGTLAMSGL
jgi:hypothetical protein